MKRIHCLTLFTLFLCFQFASAQTDSANQQLHFKISANYNSGLNYYGRTDSLKSSGFFPLAELWFGKNVYVNAAPVFINNAVQSFDYAGTVTSIGYLHTSDKWITNLFFLKPLYRKNIQLPQSALQAQASASFSYLNKIVNFTFGGDVKYSNQFDFGTTAGVDHIFKKIFSDKSVIVVDPSFYMYAGTQNFTNTYYKNTIGSILVPGTTEVITENVQKFNVLSYEVSMPVVYAKGKVMLLVTPAYVMPQNLITIPNHPELSEKGTNMFYTTIAVKLTL